MFAAMFVLMVWSLWRVGFLGVVRVRFGWFVRWVGDGLGICLSPEVVCSYVGVGGRLLRVMVYLVVFEAE